MGKKRMRFIFFIIALILNCNTFLFKDSKLDDIKFDYTNVSKNYFNPNNEKPFPLTVRRGNNLYGTISKDNQYLFYTGDSLGNLNIYIRDLKSSLTIPLTLHPSADYKPSVSPDGKYLAFVSERFDSEGDIFIAELKTKEWMEKFSRGESISDTFSYYPLTNPDYLTKNIINRGIDTDPTWSPDGRFLAYCSDKDSKSITNIYITDIKNNYNTIKITEKGAANPTFSPDGKFIYFISYRDNSLGEVYKVEISSKVETRITDDKFMDLSPSISDDGKFLFYTSIRNDTNKNGKLGARDNGYIIRRDIEKNSTIELTAGNFPLFDTKYSSFSGGSILFSGSFDNSINIYFIPSTGEIPKEKSIGRQYELADRYRDRSSDYSKFAYDSISNFFGDDPLFPLFKSRSDRQLLRDLDSEGREKESKKLSDTMKENKFDPNLGYSYALAVYHQSKKSSTNPIPDLLNYYDELKDISNLNPQIRPSVLHLIGETYEESGKSELAGQIYQKIINEYPDFYRMDEVKILLGGLEFRKDKEKIPGSYVELLGEKINRRNRLLIITDIQKAIESVEISSKQKEYIDKLLSDSNSTVNIDILGLLNYSKAKILRKEDNFRESNSLIEEYLGKLKPNSYVYLLSILLKYENYRDLGEFDNAQKSLLSFISNYEYQSGVPIDPEIFESTLQSFENKAKTEELKENLQEALVNYNRNLLFLSFAIEKKLPLNKIYSNYSTYYHKKIIDSAMNLSQGKRENIVESLISDVNILTGKRINLIGKTTETLSGIFSYKLFRFIGDFRDLNIISTYDNNAFEIPEKYYKERKEIAQKTLDLGTLYGYSYLLISKAITKESIYLEKNNLTERRKREILVDLKEAELNLQWILYANPNFSEAYLLLGYLYQYIDVKKSSVIEWENKRDEELFERLYTQYFPLKYLEENVELYKQILENIEKTDNKKLQSDLNLNLGNTFFLLNDFENAIKNYQNVEKLSKSIIPSVQFESYKQKTFYLYNFARANIYAGLTEKSIPYIKEAISIYLKEEYYPLVSKIGIDKDNPLNENLKESKKKLALLNALQGLAEMELEKYNDAIFLFTTALSMNGESNYLNDIGLYNSLAICYQKIGDYKKSGELLRNAEFEYNQKKSKLSKILSYTIWDSLFPENLRIIGDGRFPGSMPIEYTNLITRSVQIQNSMDNKEYSSAYKQLNDRLKFIRSNSLNENTAGKKIENKFNTELGYTEFLKGNYLESSEIFTKDYNEKTLKGETTEALQSYLQSDIALFSHIEEGSEKLDKLFNEINNNLKFLNKLKLNSEKKCLEQSLAIESQCVNYILKEFPNHEVSLAYNYFYLAELFFSKKMNEEALVYYNLAIDKSINPGNIAISEIGLESDPYSSSQRCKLKIIAAISNLRINEKTKFLEFLNEAYYIANEFHLEKEIYYIFLIKAEYYYSLGENKSNYSNSLEIINKIESSFKSQIGLISNISDNTLNKLYSLKLYNLIALNKYNELENINESFFSLLLYKKLLTNEFRFQDDRIFSSLNELQLLISEDIEILEKIHFSIQQKKDFTQLLSKREKNNKEFELKLKNFKILAPEGLDFLSWRENKILKKINNLNPETIVLEVYSDREKIIILSSIKNKTTITKSTLPEIKESIEEIISSNTNINKIIIIPSVDLYNFNFNSMVNDNSKKIEVSYLFRKSQLKNKVNSEYSRLKRISHLEKEIIPSNNLLSVFKKGKIKETSSNIRVVNEENLKDFLPDTDILSGNLDYSNKKLFLGEKKEGFIPLKEVIESQWNIPILLINNYQSDESNYIKTGFLFDILNFTNIKSLLVLDKNEVNQQKKEILRNLSDLTKKVKIFGESLNPYPENYDKYEEEFEKYSRIASGEERKKNYLESIKFYLLANSVIPENRKDLQITSEINLIRIKKRLFRDFNFKDYLSKLLQNYPGNSKEEEKVLFGSLVTCYEDIIYTDCDDFYNLYKKNSFVSNENKLIIDYYKALNDGNIKFIVENKTKFSTLKFAYDEYLHHLNLAVLYSGVTLWNYALDEIILCIDKTKDKVEIDLANSIKSDIYYEYFFIKGIELNLDNKDKASFFGKNRIWGKYNEVITQIFKKESDSFKREYISRIYKSYELIERSPDFQPISLSPIFLKTGEPSIYLLKESDRMFLFHILTKVIPFQKGAELNNQFDLLVETERSLKNYNRALWMEIQWASFLFSRGDLISAKKYLLNFEDNFKDINSENSIKNVYLHLKYKLSILDEKVKISEDKKIFLRKNYKKYYQFYEEAEKVKEESEYYTLIENIIKLKKNEKIDTYNQREFLDFLSYILFEAEQKKYFNLILDVTYFKEKFLSTNDKFVDNPKFYNIPPLVKNISKNLNKNIPANQDLIALCDIGIKTFKIKITSESIEVNEIFSDNRIQKNLIFDYLNSIKDFGESSLQQKYIEEIYRKSLNLTPNKITYLFFPSYHFKVYLDPNESDKFYYTLALEELTKKKSSNLNKNFNYPYNISHSGKPTSIKEKILFDLIQMEVKLFKSSKTGKEIQIVNESLTLKDDKTIEFNGKRFNQISDKKKPSIWIFTGSKFQNSSIRNDDFSQAFFTLNKYFEGPGIISSGVQTDVNTAYFIKEFLRKDGPDSLFERYTDAMKNLKLRFSEDRFWIGYKSYTNVFIN